MRVHDENDGPTLADILQPIFDSAKAALERGDTDRATEDLGVVLGALADALDPARAGQGPRLIPLEISNDGMMDLPTVRRERPGGGWCNPDDDTYAIMSEAEVARRTYSDKLWSATPGTIPLPTDEEVMRPIVNRIIEREAEASVALDGETQPIFDGVSTSRPERIRIWHRDGCPAIDHEQCTCDDAEGNNADHE